MFLGNSINAGHKFEKKNNNNILAYRDSMKKWIRNEIQMRNNKMQTIVLSMMIIWQFRRHYNYHNYGKRNEFFFGINFFVFRFECVSLYFVFVPPLYFFNFSLFFRPFLFQFTSVSVFCVLFFSHSRFFLCVSATTKFTASILMVSTIRSFFFFSFESLVGVHVFVCSLN